MAPFFSIILPVYNVAAYLERCLGSILSQNFDDYEIILVDDGSTDASPEICDRYAKEKCSVRVIHQENGGLSCARNAGLAQAQGQYVWFVDSDDWIEPDALSLLHEACHEQPDMVKFSHFRVAGEKWAIPGLIEVGRYRGREALTPICRQAFCRAGKYLLSVWSHVYRRSFLEAHQLRFVSERLICSEDYMFNLQALLHVEELVVLEQPLYCYELRPGSLTQTYKPDQARRYTELYRLLREYHRQQGALEKVSGLIDRFYVWHLMAGTCFAHAYRHGGNACTMQEARGHVRAMLTLPEMQQAIRGCDREGLSFKRIVQMLAMRWKLEGLFYYLYVVKPAKRK